jgi:nitroreductase
MIKEIKEHRSIRNYADKQIPDDVMEEILLAGTRASTIGNMQVYSMIVTTDKETKSRLAECHFNQPAATTAPAIITFCADINRFDKWCRLRGAEPRYDNFEWFVNGAIDALLASQNVALEAEAHGLGICYLGTAIYTSEQMAEVLNLPHGVVPVAAISVGYPEGEVPLTDRLPLEGVVHRDTYHDYSDEDIERIWREREASEETAELIKVNELPNLARIFTERRYTAEDNLSISRNLLEFIKKQGFFNQ